MAREEPLDPRAGTAGSVDDAAAVDEARGVGDSDAVDETRPVDEAATTLAALRRLEERLDRASDATERLVREAAAEALAPGASSARPHPPPEPDAAPPYDAASKPPPAGWQVPESEPRSARTRGADEIESLIGLVQSLRELIPPELAHRLAQAVREVLLALRALIDWYLERLERRPPEPAEVQDIAIL